MIVMDKLNEGVKKLLTAHEQFLEVAELFNEAGKNISKNIEDDLQEIKIDCYALTNEIDKICLKVFEAKAKI